MFSSAFIFKLVDKDITRRTCLFFKSTKKYLECKPLVLFYTSCRSASLYASRRPCLRPNKSKQSAIFSIPEALRRTTVRHQSTKLLDINTNVKNNVVLYKFEKTRLFIGMKAFAVLQFIGCIIGAYNMAPDLYEATQRKKYTFRKYMKDYGIAVIGLIFLAILGPLVLATTYGLCARSVKYIILHKGGDKITITTYHTLKNKSTFSVPVNQVESTNTRMEKRSYLPLKIQNRSFYYLLDARGTFVNGELYDATIGFTRE